MRSHRTALASLLLCGVLLGLCTQGGNALHCYVTKIEGHDSHEGHEEDGHESHSNRNLLVHVAPEPTVIPMEAVHDEEHDYGACVTLQLNHLDECHKWDAEHPDRCADNAHEEGHDEEHDEEHEEGEHDHRRSLRSLRSSSAARHVLAEDEHDHEGEGSHDGDNVSLQGFFHMGIESLGNLTCDGHDDEHKTEEYRAHAAEKVNHMLKEEGIHHMTAHFSHKDILMHCCTFSDLCNDDMTEQSMTLTVSRGISVLPHVAATVGLALVLLLALVA